MPLLPFEPESTPAASRRLREALIDVYDPANMPVRPGEQRKHVFDFTDGLRIIASRDLIYNLPVVHVSASIHGDRERETTVRNGRPAFIRRINERWASIGGQPLRLLGFTGGKGIPHFFEDQTIS